MRKVALVLSWLLGEYLIVRAVAELFVIDWGNSASYARDWALVRNRSRRPNVVKPESRQRRTRQR